MSFEKHMPSPSESTVTRLLKEAEGGNKDALDKLFPLVYEALREQAHRQRQRLHGRDSLNTTALVHETYLKLLGPSRVKWTNRAHFMAVAAKAMRHILVDSAERRNAQKRGGGARVLPLDELKAVPQGQGLTEEHADTVLALHEALSRLESEQPLLGRIVECRFFGGMTIKETATAFNIAPATVKRKWILARAWLYRELEDLSA